MQDTPQIRGSRLSASSLFRRDIKSCLYVVACFRLLRYSDGQESCVSSVLAVPGVRSHTAIAVAASPGPFPSGAQMSAKFTDYIVKDLALAEWGRKEISLAETEMPGLMATSAE